MRFGELLEAADQLSIEDQEDLLDVLRRRVIERRRDQLALDVQQARHEHKSGGCEPASPDAILQKILQ